MIEVIYKDDEKNANSDHTGNWVRLPKNVTQIGQGNGNERLKIYIENQVLKNMKSKSEDGVVYGVLIGKKEHDDVEYIFVKNNIEVRNNQENVILFNDDIWLYIYDEIKRKGLEGDIVGWYVNFPEDRMKNLGQLKKLHLDNFAGINKLLFCYEEETGEDGVYIYNNNILEKQPVYYIYWGKNGTAKTVAAANYDKKDKVLEKERKQEKAVENVKRVPWGSVAVIAVLVGVLAFMGNSGMLKSLTDRAQSLIENSGEENSPIVNDVDAENKTTDPEETTVNTAEETTEPTTEPTTQDEETTTVTEEETTADEVSGVVSGTEYIVKAGETLYDICREQYGSLDMIKRLIEVNELENPDKILAGQKLILPDQ